MDYLPSLSQLLVNDPLLLEAFLWTQKKERNTDILKSILYFFELNSKDLPMMKYLLHKEISHTRKNMFYTLKRDFFINLLSFCYFQQRKFRYSERTP